MVLLAPLGVVTGRAMFGGYGLFYDATMFALVSSDGVLHFKADASTQDDFEDDARFGKMPYYRVPAKVRANTRSLRAWAKRAIAVALDAQSKKKKKKKKR